MSQNAPAKIDPGLSVKQVCAILGCGRTKLYSMVAAGELPEPYRIGSKSIWPASVVYAVRDALPRGFSISPNPRARKGAETALETT
ncbi:MAG: helix-turn-helix domain-containing protein [Kiloniellales bacterium]|nr:helix-turn-helix domain-containing protein [Kiloniellales bacterium]